MLVQVMAVSKEKSIIWPLSAVGVCIIFPLVRGGSCTEGVEEVSITAEGCFSRTVLNPVTRCTGEEVDQCVANYTTISRVLQCHDGYQKHNSTVLSFIATPSNSTGKCILRAEVMSSVKKSAGLLAYIYMQPTIVLGGLAGNMLSFLVMSSKYMRQFPFSVYLKALAVLDSLVLIHYGMTYVDIINHENPPLAGFRIKGYVACMIYPYLVRVAQLSSAWCVVLFTVDRAVAICYPFFACRHVTIFRARAAVVVVVSVLMLSQLYHLILLSPDTIHCHDPFSFPITASEFGQMEVLVLFSRIALLFLIPLLTVLCCNLKVIFTVKRSNKIVHLNLQRSTSSSMSHNRAGKSDAERKMSIKLFSVSISYLLLSLPNAAVILADLRGIMLGQDQWYSQHKTIRVIARMIFSLNFAVNYLLYAFAFRKQAVLCMYCKKTSHLNRPMSQNQLSSSNDSRKTTSVD